MIRNIKLAAIFILFLWLGTAFISRILFISISTLGGVCGFLMILFVILNNLVKKTNWFKNQYLHTKQFVSNTGYRDNIIRNYDIINLGSNPALYGFFYEGVKGQNWATGSQGLDMDFEILKYYHSYLKKGGVVIIPIMPFTAISPYIKTKKGYWDVRYYSKFYRILGYAQQKCLPHNVDIKLYERFPLLYYKYAIKYLIKDIQCDRTYQISEQPMMTMELMQDAEYWMNLWYKEFDLVNINDVCDVRWSPWIEEASTIIKDIIDFCLKRELRPVLVYLPFTKYLTNKFTKEAKNLLLYDFLKRVNIHNIEFLDYSADKYLQNESLYQNSLFLNMRGRKVFTERLLSDLKLK